MFPPVHVAPLSARHKTAFPLYSPSRRHTVPLMATPTLQLAAFGIGGMELVLILALALLLFGGAKLPSLARGLGQSIKEFKKATKDEEETKEEQKKEITH